ncbi:DJ-1/PfpI family protein [Curtobacterium sp. ISL-83]|uniref:DJ-1/PfpI family protein n=1 Tax=Curtobacterium sp. ISL-83 TaxID=2819145 RepID=UPI001BE7D565|nr:DJ-1/PfpI family protein [Curtobacterium sp. ISL-83]MBT2504182.1 DJ-1/PfpI family protein [Curtobacterium sp. ISL-83]
MTHSVSFVSLLFPHVTQLDLTGPVQLFSRLPGATIDLAWHRVEPVPTDSGFAILPTTTFADAPQATVLMVPGGQGAFDLMDDPVALDFVRKQAANARYVTSVCTGAFILGAAGLLIGKRATTHWASHPLLTLLGAVPEQARVVRDGNIITGGGVTSGIDFALTVAAEVYDEATARAVQLTMEYDPHPPFDAGSPARPEADQEQVHRALTDARTRRGPAIERAAAKLNRESRFGEAGL